MSELPSNTWELSTPILEQVIKVLRGASTGEDGLELCELWALCDEAADIIEGLMHYEQSHGLRSTTGEQDED